MIWIPAIAVSGMTFYTGDRFPRWKGDVFVGSTSRTGESGYRPSGATILFNDKMEELRREALLRELRQHVSAMCMSKAPTDCCTCLPAEERRRRAAY